MLDSGINQKILALQRDLYKLLLTAHGVEKHQLEDFLRSVLSTLMGLTDTRIGYIEVRESETNRTWSTQVCDENSAQRVRQIISSTIVHSSMERGEVIFTRSAILDPDWKDSKSVRSGNIETVLCAPFANGNCKGVLYLQGNFSEALPGSLKNHLEFPELFHFHISPLLPNILPAVTSGGSFSDFVLTYSLTDFIGKSRALETVLREAVKVSGFPMPVLLLGETGTGKSHLARAIHRTSGRKGRFLQVNCPALPQELFESELFGHLKGAFTGATENRMGLVEVAEGGTLFLDEIGELPLEQQKKLLVLLEEGVYLPVGSRTPKKANVRIITATNRDLRQAVREGSFRKDLFFRISVYPIQSPALRERKEDIPVLGEFFLRKYCRDASGEILKLPLRYVEMLRKHSWPGNIRELENFFQRLAVHAAGAPLPDVPPDFLLLSEDFEEGDASGSGPLPAMVSTPSEGTSVEAQSLALRSDRDVWQRKRVETDLHLTGWNVAETARRLNLSRSQIYNLIQKYGLQRSD